MSHVRFHALNTEYNIPERFPTHTIDRVFDFYSCTTNATSNLELQFAHQLDEERLARALELILDAEPTLGCRFVAHWRRPYWQRLHDIGREIFSVAKNREEYETFKAAPIDTCVGPQIKACLLPSSTGDWLLLKIAHHVSDAAGDKEIVAIVSQLYSRLAHEPKYSPEPNLGCLQSSLWQVLRHIPRHVYPRVLRNSVKEFYDNLRPPVVLTLPLEDGPHEPLTYVSRHITVDHVALLRKYGHAQDATLNDLMLSAFFRALVVEGNWDGRTQLRVQTTVDLRRYLPSPRGIGVRNLSSAEYVRLGTDLGGDFASTLARVTAVTRQQKANWPGLHNCVGLLPIVAKVPHRYEKRRFARIINRFVENRKMPYRFSTTGPISPEDVTFDSPPLNAWYLPVSGYPPHVFASFSGYAGKLTLFAGVYPKQRDALERFCDRIVSELPV